MTFIMILETAHRMIFSENSMMMPETENWSEFNLFSDALTIQVG